MLQGSNPSLSANILILQKAPERNRILFAEANTGLPRYFANTESDRGENRLEQIVL